MKKLIFGAAAIAAVAMASCSGNKTAGASEADTDVFAVSAATSDSVNQAFGNMVRASILSEYTRLDSAMKAEQPKSDILKGVQYAMGAPEKPGVTVGMQIGLQMLGNVQRMRDLGIEPDRTAILNAFKKTFMSDSSDAEGARAAQMAYQMLMTRIQEESKAFEDAKKANAPEALENVAAGEKFLAAAMAADPDVKVSESGLGYKIENEGEGEKITRQNLARVKYTGRLVDGTVFDSSDDARLSPSGVVKGFGEGLQMLGKGGKATLYIPGKLAYGVDGAPRAGIGPNAMLVFDIEILDVN
ncbi:MAG: FKBP-type peptidyl-prolyl cis-trans isomerase [Muribaculaceae bacterium]|nr:FKBP-type peptidyl-prolyl cis-trans isomerase [Muribaculaceae bacterium]